MQPTLKEEGYSYVGYAPAQRGHVLKNEDGNYELWFANKYHASSGLRFRNTDLEFVSSLTERTALFMAHK